MALGSIATGAASFLFGLLGCCFPIPCTIAALPLSLIAVGTGIVALARQNKEPDRYTGKGLAIAGIALGGTWLLLGILWILLALTGTIGNSLIQLQQFS
ncbi:MAG TPA: DUF4190 domain-containing protein [Sandaracinaceae bacterium]